MLVGAADAMTPAHQGESILSYFYFFIFYKNLQGSGGYLSEVQSKDAMYNRIWRGGATYQTGLLRLLADSRQCYSVHCVQPRVSSDLAALSIHRLSCRGEPGDAALWSTLSSPQYHLCCRWLLELRRSPSLSRQLLSHTAELKPLLRVHV